MSDLTAKQARFVEEYLIDLNATQAAIRAGYAEKGASVEGARLLANAKVGEAVAAGLKARSERTQIDADWVLTRLAEEATADLADLYDDNGNLKPIREWPTIWRTGLVAGIETLQEYETVDGKKELLGTVRKVKLSDRIKRVELIGKHVAVQAFREQVGHSDPNGNPLAASVDELSKNDIARRVAFLLAQGMNNAAK